MSADSAYAKAFGVIGDPQNPDRNIEFDVPDLMVGQVANAAQPIPVNEAEDTGPIVLATFTDPDGPQALGNYSADINWGDDTPTEPGAVDVASGAFEVRGNHRYADNLPSNAPYNVTVTIHHVSMADAIVFASLTVNNAAPSAALSTPATITYGDTATVSFSDAVDPSAVDAAAGFHYAYATTSTALDGATYANTSTAVRAVRFHGSYRR